MNTEGFAVRSTSRFGFSSDSATAAYGIDTELRRDAADTLAQRRGTNPQQFRVYNATGTNSGEFALMGWSTGLGISPTFVVGPQQTNSGILRDLTLTGANINLASSGVTNFNNRPRVNGTGVLLSGEAAQVDLSSTVRTTGDQSISGAKTFDKTQLNLSGSSLNFYPVIETGATVTVTQANDAVTQTIDTVSDDVELTRGIYGVLYNPINDAEGDSNPTNTEWNTDGWSDLSNLSSRSYINLNQVGGAGNFGNAVIGTELIMHDTSTDKYHKFLFSEWQAGAGNSSGYRGFSYTRTEVTVSSPQINGSGVRGNLDFYNRPSVNGTGVLLIGEAGQVPDTVVQTSGTQTISGSKTFTASTLFTSNIQASNIQASNIQANNTGIFSDMQISADEMNLSGLDLTISSGNLVLSSPTGIPATTGASGIKGSFVWDTGHLYVCTNTNSWRRVALTTW
jgi:hypothetical protein